MLRQRSVLFTVAVTAVSLIFLSFSRNVNVQARRAVERQPEPSSQTPALSDKKLFQLLQYVKADDDRLFRWSAIPETVRRREEDGACEELTSAAEIVMDPSARDGSKAMAAEFLTFCITDSPEHRSRFSEEDGIHQAVVDLVVSDNVVASTMAAHLIYISTFGNHINHQTYIEVGAIEALAKVIMNRGPDAVSSQVMWGMAAIQNLMASYCDTKNDGRCYWGWTPNTQDVEIRKRCLPVVSDGSRARRAVLKVKGLVPRLIELACTGPVHGKARPTNVFPGENAIMNRDDNDPHVLAWAAAGALKNLALEPSAKLQLEPVLLCMCGLQNSPDWLESAKSSDFLHFMRRGGDPCWLDGGKDKTRGLCIDDNFLDSEGYNCGDYGGATTDECLEKDALRDVLAKDACCGCGGGALPGEEDDFRT